MENTTFPRVSALATAALLHITNYPVLLQDRDIYDIEFTRNLPPSQYTRNSGNGPRHNRPRLQSEREDNRYLEDQEESEYVYGSAPYEYPRSDRFTIPERSSGIHIAEKFNFIGPNAYSRSSAIREAAPDQSSTNSIQARIRSRSRPRSRSVSHLHDRSFDSAEPAIHPDQYTPHLQPAAGAFTRRRLQSK